MSAGSVPPVPTAPSDSFESRGEWLALLGSLVRALGHGVLALDAAGHVLVANATARALLGETQLEGRHISQLLPAEGGAEAWARRAREAESDAGQRERSLLERGVGRARLAFTCARLELGAGSVLLVSLFEVEGSTRSDPEQMQQALRDSEEKFANAFRACPHPIGVTELESGRIVEINDAYERTFGIPREEAIGRSTTELGMWADPKDRDHFVVLLKESGAVRDLRVLVRNRRGDTLVTRLSADVTEIRGKPHLVTFVRDVTEQTRAEEALRESEARFAAAFRSSPYPMVLLDAKQGKLLDCNDTFQSSFGHARSSALGAAPDALGMWPDLDLERSFRALLRAQGSLRDVSVKLLTKDGNERECLLSAELVEVGEEPCIVAIILDVTEQRRLERAKADLEAQLRQTQKLEALGTLAGGIAHDFNNILGAIVAYTELIGYDIDQPREIESHLAELKSASDRAKDLVAQILTFSRQQKHERRALRLDAPVQEALRLVRSTLPATVQIDAHIAASTPLVLADPTQIHQVVMNLATNAAHAMRSRQGRLRVVLEGVRVGDEAGRSAVEPGNYAKLMVSDTGEGMDEATQRRVFEPFFTTKPPGEGTGLGLAVVHGIITEYGGHISIQSQLGKGTTIEIWLPEHTASLFDAAPAPDELPRGHGETILVVDDERRLCAALETLLERLGYSVRAFSSPLAALTAFREDPASFAAILSDLTMPELTGIDLGRAMRELRPLVPIVMMSGFSASWNAKALSALGVKEVIPKPVTAHALASALRRALTRREG